MECTEKCKKGKKCDGSHNMGSETLNTGQVGIKKTVVILLDLIKSLRNFFDCFFSESKD